jgi:hypothetical protein
LPEECGVTALITTPGAYLDIDNADYHRNPSLLPAPSLSSSGAKKLLNQSPLHFWFDSPMNPDRPPETEKAHFAIGKAAHDMILLSERWPEHYHVLPEGFGWNKTKAMPEAIAEAEEARAAGKCILRDDEAETVRQVVAALTGNKLAMSALTNGVAEETLAWKDPLTGVWLRARPDFRPHSLLIGAAVRIVSDLKFMAPTYCSPDGFQRAIENNGYHLSAAFYSDGLKAVFDVRPTHWLHVVIEKEAPHCVSLYELPAEDIERGRTRNREAIEMVDRCLQRGTDRASWPGYADAPRPVGLPGWARKRIDESATDAVAWSAAA